MVEPVKPISFPLIDQLNQVVFFQDIEDLKKRDLECLAECEYWGAGTTVYEHLRAELLPDQRGDLNGVVAGNDNLRLGSSPSYIFDSLVQVDKLLAH